MSLLKNGDFNQVNQEGPVSAFTRQASGPGGGQSGAAHWTTWVTSVGGTIKTELTTSTFPGSKGSMLTVDTNGGGGIVQGFVAGGGGPAVATACVWLFVESGQAGVGVGDGGNTRNGVVLVERNKWERLTVGNGVSPANQIVVYAHQPVARFHLAYAAVHAGHPWEQQALCLPG